MHDRRANSDGRSGTKEGFTIKCKVNYVVIIYQSAKGQQLLEQQLALSSIFFYRIRIAEQQYIEENGVQSCPNYDKC